MKIIFQYLIILLIGGTALYASQKYKSVINGDVGCFSDPISITIDDSEVENYESVGHLDYDIIDDIGKI